MSGAELFFYVLAVLAITSALAMVFTPRPVYAVLFMVVNFMAVALLYLQLEAPFLAAVQVLVYAGAIMVLFLFVVMLMGPSPAPLWEHIPAQRPLALLFSLGVLGALVVAIRNGSFTQLTGTMTEAIAAAGGQSQALAEHLYSRYLLPFELTSLILLVGILGAVVLARMPRRKKTTTD